MQFTKADLCGLGYGRAEVSWICTMRDIGGTP